MDDLVTWLRDQLDDDERKVAAMEREEVRVTTAPIFQGHPPNWLAGVDIFVSSKRWRAEIDAKRRILDFFARDASVNLKALTEPLPQDLWNRVHAARQTVRLLTLPYADRDGYREEWRS